MRQIKVTPSITRHDSESLVQYLKEIQRIGFLSPDEESRLIKQYREGDLDAMEKVVKANLRFVVSIAKHYQHQGLSLSDLVSEGNIGLIKAVEQFDETKGFKFISYAVWWIRQSIIYALTEHSRIIRLPRNKVTSLSKITQLFKQLEQEFERAPTHEELSEATGLDLDEVRTMIGYESKPVSIDAPISLDEAKSLLDIIEDVNAEIPDHHVTYKESLKKEIGILMAGLNHNQCEIVKMYFGFSGNMPMNMYEISQKMNLSSERIRQIKEAALQKMKEKKNARLLKDYLDK